MDTDLPIQWSMSYRPGRDITPEACLTAGIVAPSRSRRLGRYADAAHERKGYVGVYHQQIDPAQTWFFLSLFVQGQIIGLWSYPTIPEVLTRLTTFHQQEI